MDKMSRVQVGNQILKQIYDENASLSDEEIANLFYEFLLVPKGDSHLTTEKICFRHDIRPEQLLIYKHDIMLEIVLRSYEYLYYVKTFCKLPDLETELLKDLDAIPFSLQNIHTYFQNPQNEEKIKRAIIDYFTYITQDEAFKEACLEYHFGSPKEFREKLLKYIQYIEASDVIASIYEETAEKYCDEEADEEEEFPEEEYPDMEDFELRYDEEEGNLLDAFEEDEEREQEEQNYRRLEKEQKETFELVLDFLENFYDDKYDADDFIGYFMSIVYALLLKMQEKNLLTLEDEVMLQLLSRKDASFELVVESFWYSKEYVFNALELFAREYYREPENVFYTRENYREPIVMNRFHLLDPIYTKPKEKFHFIYCGNPLIPIFEEILNEKRNSSPDTYCEDIYQMLRNLEVGREAFTKKNLDTHYVPIYQSLMIRYLARKWIEEIANQKLGSLSTGEIFVYQGLMEADITHQNIQKLFDMGYQYFIMAYFQIHDQEQSYERHLIRHLQGQNLLGRVLKIDMACLGDPTYLKTVGESAFYRKLEEKGIPETLLELRELVKTNPLACQTILKEIILMNYYYAKSHEQGEISSKIIELLEGDAVLEPFYQMVINQEDLLKELLTRYVAEENDTQHALCYEDRVELASKVKKKLYPERRENY